ncbi:MAG: hypothetical protein U5L06_15255 [Rhodovibrio sp.]|nr:hypothetical protein [Rhodovibrio sp.]
MGIERDARLRRRSPRQRLDGAPIDDARRRSRSQQPASEPRRASRSAWLVERGLLQPGAPARPPAPAAFAAKVRADGTIASARPRRARSTRSAPRCRARPACNGWTFWHVVQDDGSLVALDVLRPKLRAELT